MLPLALGSKLGGGKPHLKSSEGKRNMRQRRLEWGHGAMSIERSEAIRFHEQGTLNAVTRWIGG